MKVFICLFAAVAAVSAAWVGDYTSGHGGFMKPGFGYAKVPIVKVATPVAGFGGYGAGVHGAGFVGGPGFIKSAGPVASFGGHGDFGLKQKYAGPGFGKYVAPIAAYGPGVVKAPIGPVVLKTAAVPIGPVAYGKFGPAGFANGGHWKKQ